MAGWYRQFIANFADLSGPLTDCLRKGKKFELTPAAIEGFNKLKAALSSAPVLVQPDFTKEFTIQCDASSVGVGGVLFQLDDEGRERPIAFVSKKLNKSQRNYTVTELECFAAVICLKRFRPYIEGLPFRVITDHASLKWLMSLKDLDGRLARWSLKLQAFVFKIEHRKGSLNVVPDTLSRADMEELSLDDIPKEIDLNSPEFESKEYVDLREKIKANSDMLPDLCVSENFIYKRTKFREGKIDEEDSLWMLWIPKNLTRDVIENAHNSATACHGGHAKTLFRIRQKYFWPGMANDVREYIDSCDMCKGVKASCKVLRPTMGNQIKTERPFQRLYVDFLGPYPRTKDGNSVIFIVIDHFSKFLFVKAMKKATSVNVINYLQSEVFNFVGVPQYLHSDNGRQFISKDFAAFLNTFGIQHVTTALYSPQANVSERANREIIAKLRCFIGRDHTKWDKYLSQITAILRSDYHNAIKCSPYFATLGQNMIQHVSAYGILNDF